MRIVNNDVTSFVLALYRISSVSTVKGIECSLNSRSGSTVKISCSCRIKSICNVMASGNVKAYLDPILFTDNDVEYGKAVNKLNVLCNEVRLPASCFTYFAVCCACNDLGELTSNLGKILFSFSK